MLMLRFSPVKISSRSARCDSSTLHTEVPSLKPFVSSVMPCLTYFRPIFPACRHITVSTFVRPKNEPTNQGTLESPRAGIKWPKVEPGSPKCCHGENCHGFPNERILTSFSFHSLKASRNILKPWFNHGSVHAILGDILYSLTVGERSVRRSSWWMFFSTSGFENLKRCKPLPNVASACIHIGRTVGELIEIFWEIKEAPMWKHMPMATVESNSLLAVNLHVDMSCDLCLCVDRVWI